ncbi:hypothetical protein GCK72_025430 [Caenorhabditis remanei]|uniref:Uncharacterized protein n=1 Tax=Caenorhabditis remanei TaxID=31234 RepID=A0A6A5G2D8_CAERE|nr:hypothetical protein GCK72_025430 [Caenorhabditis remanei]KAF1748963.1 hypothetical protein GCK72_025430 [Caenorhabditis remanei]
MPSESKVERVLTVQEIEDLKGKTRCLYKLFKNPRMMLAELKPTLVQLLESMHILTLCADVPHSDACRKIVDLGMKQTAILEDIVIRVVLCGETVKEVAEKHLRRVTQNKKSIST